MWNHHTSSKTSEYVLSSSDELIADCTAGEGVQLSVALRNIVRSISLDIQQRNKENRKLWPKENRKLWPKENRKLWPPIPQDIISKSEEKGNICLYDLIALIVNPNSPFDIDGSVKLSKGKTRKQIHHLILTVVWSSLKVK